MEPLWGQDAKQHRRDAAIDATKAGYFMPTEKVKTRIKKNFVLSWTGKRGGQNERKFFTKDGADKVALDKKAEGFRHVKVRRQTRQKVNVVT